MNIGDIVVVINTESLPDSFLGRYGRVTDRDEYNVMVEFNTSVKGIGGLSHTAYPSDLKKIGEVEKARQYKNALEEISDILDGQNVTPLVESLAYVLGKSGIYDNED